MEAAITLTLYFALSEKLNPPVKHFGVALKSRKIFIWEVGIVPSVPL